MTVRQSPSKMEEIHSEKNSSFNDQYLSTEFSKYHSQWNGMIYAFCY